MFGTIRYIMATVQRHTDRTMTDYGGVDEVFLHFQSFGDSAQAFCSFLLFCVFDNEICRKFKNRVTCRNGEYEEISSSNLNTNHVNTDPRTNNASVNSIL